MKYVAPSVTQKAFNCPHCGALAKQFWHWLRAERNDEDRPLPFIVNGEEDLHLDGMEDGDGKRALIEWARRIGSGSPFLERREDGKWLYSDVYNLFLSLCYNCEKSAIWIHDRLVYPAVGEVPQANPDMPEDIRRDYDEAGAILSQSPRGAAALIRLAIQKLCRELGQPGKNINDDIGELVRGGLDPRIQQALDVVRVVGNGAVHPGQIDLRDDRATAETLFKLLNLVVDKMISEPKHVAEIYSSLPAGALSAIERRDGKKD